MPVKGNVLDIGCGEGLYALSVKILRPNMSVTIIDSNKDKLKIQLNFMKKTSRAKLMLV